MGLFVNPDNSAFQVALNSEIYIDKTGLLKYTNKVVSSQVVGEIVMNKLKNLEAVAYVRFASVYREFKDINTFMDELKKVLEN